MKRFSLGKGTRASLSVVMTVLIVAAVLLINAGISALFSRNLYFIDLTGYERKSSTTNNETWVYENYTLTDEIVEFMDTTFAELNAARQSKGEEAVSVEIVFCDDPDNLLSSSLYQRMVYMAALQLQKHFPDTIHVRTVDIYKNPSAVQQYKTNAYTTIYPSTVIVSSGTEVRRLSVSSFFFNDSTTGELWASNVEVKFASAIRAVGSLVVPPPCPPPAPLVFQLWYSHSHCLSAESVRETSSMRADVIRMPLKYAAASTIGS
jgi:hypothetical protein